MCEHIVPPALKLNSPLGLPLFVQEYHKNFVKMLIFKLLVISSDLKETINNAGKVFILLNNQSCLDSTTSKNKTLIKGTQKSQAEKILALEKKLKMQVIEK